MRDVKLRKVIELPDDIPAEFFEEFVAGDPNEEYEQQSLLLHRHLDSRRNARELLFQYFNIPYRKDAIWPDVRTKVDAENLAFAIAALIFPAFRPVSEYMPKKRGGRRAKLKGRPKYEVSFLIEVADAIDKFRHDSNLNRTLSSISYNRFLNLNPHIAKHLRVNAYPLRFSSFKKYLSLGRTARDLGVIWHVHTKKYIRFDNPEIHPVMAGILEGCRHLSDPFPDYEIVELIVLFDQTKTYYWPIVNIIYDNLEAQLQRQIDAGVKSPRQKPFDDPIDPLWLMKKNGKFNP